METVAGIQQPVSSRVGDFGVNDCHQPYQPIEDLQLKRALEEEKRAECLAIVTAYLEHEIRQSDSSKGGAISKCHTPFHNKCQPRISLTDYVHRLAKFTNASSLCFVMACCYIDRLCKERELCSVTKQTAHRLLLCGVLLAAKLADDKFRSNAFFSKVGGVSKAALNEMEMQMFLTLDYSLFLSEEAIAKQLLLMCDKVGADVLDVKLKDDSALRRSKKRISEDVGFGSEDDLPAKLLHGEQCDTVMVTADKHKDEANVSVSMSEASRIFSAVVSRETSRQSSLSSCAQEVLASERVDSLKTPAAIAVPGP